MKIKLVFRGVLFVLLSAVVLSACYKSKSTYGSGATSNTIYMKGSTFSNANLQVKTGSTITWMNDDNITHTVTADDTSFDSGDIVAGAKFNMTFNVAGTYAYHCKYHSGMKGTVVVVY
jgi:plastocyanin